MRKFISSFVAIVLMASALVAGLQATIYNDVAFAASDEELRAVWVPTVYNLSYPSKTGLSVDALKREADTVLNNAKDMGFNAVIFQVRPGADALYKSKIYPWSRLVSGTQGVAPAGGFDPLQYFIDGAHSRGMELHAWVNPYRVTTGEWEYTFLSSNNPAVLYPELTVKHTDGKVYFNPGEPKARQLVIDGITEIVDNYDVDGIHLDDYFYPDTKFADEATYAKYGAGYNNIGDWRRSNNDELIKGINTAIKQRDPKVAFGVSPFGVWANKTSHPLGSSTKNNESYYAHYADTRKWVKEETIDYIMPQIYWEIGNTNSNYDTIANWWTDVVKGTNVKLYIGMAAYRAIDAGNNTSSPWYNGKEMVKQINYNRANPAIKGYAMYAYQSLMANKGMYDAVKTANKATAPVTPIVPQKVNATVSKIKVMVDGKQKEFTAYNIAGNNYFKLRDIAYTISGTEKQFEVDWDQGGQTINLWNGSPYTPVGGEMNVDKYASNSTGSTTTADIYLDRIKIRLAAYNIKNNNYFKLRDLGQTFNFATDWDNSTRTIYIDTTKAYTPE